MNTIESLFDVPAALTAEQEAQLAVDLADKALGFKLGLTALVAGWEAPLSEGGDYKDIASKRSEKLSCSEFNDHYDSPAFIAGWESAWIDVPDEAFDGYNCPRAAMEAFGVVALKVQQAKEFLAKQ